MRRPTLASWVPLGSVSPLAVVMVRRQIAVVGSATSGRSSRASKNGSRVISEGEMVAALQGVFGRYTELPVF